MRKSKKLSQRKLAALAGIAYKTLQLLEGGRHDPQLSSLDKVAVSLGYPLHGIQRQVERYFQRPVDGVAAVSECIHLQGENSWKLWLFNFVDSFRAEKDSVLIAEPPVIEASSKIQALLASTVEALCAESGTPAPVWCEGVPGLAAPWFLSGLENLKALSLVESPAYFRKRNLFVLGNFLERR